MMYLLTLVVALSSAPDPTQDAKSLAQDILTKGAALFDSRDAAAMAATYTEKAQVTAYSRDDETGALKTETGRGRADVQKFYAELSAVMKLPDVRQKLIEQGTEPVGAPPAEFRRFMEQEIEKWTKVARAAKVSL